jgi:hypothetical protein
VDSICGLLRFIDLNSPSLTGASNMEDISDSKVMKLSVFGVTSTRSLPTQILTSALKHVTITSVLLITHHKNMQFIKQETKVWELSVLFYFHKSTMCIQNVTCFTSINHHQKFHICGLMVTEK